MIYAIHILRLQYVKIGYSSNEDVKKRIAELQTGNPFQINPLFTVAGSLAQEQALHSALRAAYAQIRIPMPPNEWYPGRNPFFARFLGQLKYGAGPALAFCEANDYLHINKGIRAGGIERHEWRPNLKWPRKPDAAAIREEFGLGLHNQH